MKKFLFILVIVAILVAAFFLFKFDNRKKFSKERTFKNVKSVFAQLFLGANDFHFPVKLHEEDHGNGYSSSCGAQGKYPDGKPSKGSLPETATCYSPYKGEDSRIFYNGHGLTHILVESYTDLEGIYETDMGEGFCNLLGYITCYAIGDSAGCKYGEKYLKDEYSNKYTTGMRKATLASWTDIFKKDGTGSTQIVIESRINKSCESTDEDKKKFTNFSKTATDAEWLKIAEEVAEAFMTQKASKLLLKNRDITFKLQFPKVNVSILFLLLVLIGIKAWLDQSIKNHK